MNSWESGFRSIDKARSYRRLCRSNAAQLFFSRFRTLQVASQTSTGLSACRTRSKVAENFDKTANTFSNRKFGLGYASTIERLLQLFFRRFLRAWHGTGTGRAGSFAGGASRRQSSAEANASRHGWQPDLPRWSFT